MGTPEIEEKGKSHLEALYLRGPRETVCSDTVPFLFAERRRGV